MKPILTMAAAAAALALAGHAQGATYILDYDAVAGTPAAALTVTASDTLNAVGGYDITAITGTVDGEAITGVISNPGQPSPSYSADGWFIFDDVIWPGGAPALSNPGVLFRGASGDEFNLFSDDAQTYELYRARAGVGYVEHSYGTLAVSAGFDRSAGVVGVPEPAVWTMAILGFGLTGAMLRRRRAALAVG